MTADTRESDEARPRRFRPYSEHRESGIEWLGQTPAHWEVRRLTDIATLVNGFPFDSKLFDRSHGTPLVRIRDLFNATTEVNWTGDPVPEAAIGDGDILIGMDGDFSVAWWDRGPALLNQRLCCVRAASACVSHRYLFYCLRFPLRALNDVTHSTTVRHLSSFDVLKFRLPFPPLGDQQAIADFLDRETAKVDALVAKKERLIQLLQEKRTALITRSVTRGLDADVAMKDSGVEWLAQIPAHWTVKRLGTTVTGCQNGVWGEEASGLHDTICVRVADFDRTRLRARLDTPTLRSIDPRLLGSRRLGQDDLLLEKSGGGDKQPVGAVVIYEHDRPAVCSNFVARMPVADGHHPRYLTYLNAALYEARINTRSIKQSTGIQNLDSASYLSEAVGLPGLREQRSIADFLDSESAHIDSLIDKVRDAVALLTEYRTALISAAVTGQIDVRGTPFP